MDLVCVNTYYILLVVITVGLIERNISMVYGYFRPNFTIFQDSRVNHIETFNTRCQLVLVQRLSTMHVV